MSITKSAKRIEAERGRIFRNDIDGNNEEDIILCDFELIAISTPLTSKKIKTSRDRIPINNDCNIFCCEKISKESSCFSILYKESRKSDVLPKIYYLLV